MRLRDGRFSTTRTGSVELHHPVLALLPVGGSYTMGPAGAAKSIELLGVKNVVPMHYGTFAFLKGMPQALAKLLEGGSLHAPIELPIPLEDSPCR